MEGISIEACAQSTAFGQEYTWRNSKYTNADNIERSALAIIFRPRNAAMRCHALNPSQYVREIVWGGVEPQISHKTTNRSRAIRFVFFNCNLGKCFVQGFPSHTKKKESLKAKCRTAKQFGRVSRAHNESSMGWGAVPRAQREGGGTPWQGGGGRLSVRQNQVSGMGRHCSV